MGCFMMAQLIKLQDYISRYEMDFFRYPGQFIRLKRENWGKLQSLWKEQKNEGQHLLENPLEEHEIKMQWFRNWFSRKPEEGLEELSGAGKDAPVLPDNVQELKKHFLDKLFPFQLKWASSTIRESSIVDQKYYHDSLLKYLLQRFPDTFLIMYYPVFQLKKAPVEAEIVMITPLKIYCIYVLEIEENVNIAADDQRVWHLDYGHMKKKILSPLISLRRTDHLVRSILDAYDIHLPSEKIVISRRHAIQYQSEPYNTVFIGKDDYEAWMNRMREIRSPLKYVQLKAGEVLLKHCQTTSMKRPEWEMNSNETTLWND